MVISSAMAASLRETAVGLGGSEWGDASPTGLHTRPMAIPQTTHSHRRLALAMNSTQSKQGTFRRTVAGIAAAGALAFGGLGTVGATDAHAASMRASESYVVAPATVQVQSGTAVTPSKGRI